MPPILTFKWRLMIRRSRISSEFHEETAAEQMFSPTFSLPFKVIFSPQAENWTCWDSNGGQRVPTSIKLQHIWRNAPNPL